MRHKTLGTNDLNAQDSTRCGVCHVGSFCTASDGYAVIRLSDLLGSEASAADHVPQSGGSLAGMHHAAKAKRVIFCFRVEGHRKLICWTTSLT